MTSDYDTFAMIPSTELCSLSHAPLYISACPRPACWGESARRVVEAEAENKICVWSYVIP